MAVCAFVVSLESPPFILLHLNYSLIYISNLLNYYEMKKKKFTTCQYSNIMMIENASRLYNIIFVCISGNICFYFMNIETIT